MAYGGAKKKKGQTNRGKQMKEKESSPCGETQHNVQKMVEESKKIKPKEVFGDNYSKSKK